MFRAFLGFFSTIFFILMMFFGVLLPLSAQTTEPSPDERMASSENTIDESSIILGEVPDIPAASGASSIFVVLRMVLVLALAALAIYGVVFFIRRLAKPQERVDPHLKVLARVALGNDSYAAVISVGAKAWLVGGGSGGLNLISEIDDPEALETMLIDDARRSAETGNRRFIDFRSLLSRLGGSSRGSGSPGSSNEENSSLTENGFLAEKLRRQRERLKGL